MNNDRKIEPYFGWVMIYKLVEQMEACTNGNHQIEQLAEKIEWCKYCGCVFVDNKMRVPGHVKYG